MTLTRRIAALFTVGANTGRGGPPQTEEQRPTRASHRLQAQIAAFRSRKETTGAGRAAAEAAPGPSGERGDADGVAAELARIRTGLAQGPAAPDPARVGR
ncbi:hypothetical protein GXW83_17330 [Streptacidiphilus sp. PB12-B1b]|uniref:hypothetical protein n=1 Tax=Streptacidiphilus sp. PB12-B1b TaxID=2705012 RepID=UPI0015F84B4E|nr:hypothetical protein [Streptacidiphilus sp. PB12-B1b]QMU77207.1 hypothetical protein GXW83_17330 [Streptacidiphilus sp. PB12-B1b]